MTSCAHIVFIFQINLLKYFMNCIFLTIVKNKDFKNYSTFGDLTNISLEHEKEKLSMS